MNIKLAVALILCLIAIVPLILISWDIFAGDRRDYHSKASKLKRFKDELKKEEAREKAYEVLRSTFGEIDHKLSSLEYKVEELKSTSNQKKKRLTK